MRAEGGVAWVQLYYRLLPLCHCNECCWSTLGLALGLGYCWSTVGVLLREKAGWKGGHTIQFGFIQYKCIDMYCMHNNHSQTDRRTPTLLVLRVFLLFSRIPYGALRLLCQM